MKKLLLIIGISTIASCVYGQQPYVIKKGLKLTSTEYLIEDPAQEKKYPLKNLIDHDPTTAWVYEQRNASQGNIGFKIEFTEEKWVDGILFSNGYLKSEKLYKANNRVRKLLIKTSAGQDIVRELKDEFSVQKMLLPKQKIKWIELIILDFVPGEIYSDHCISEFHPVFENTKLTETESSFLIENSAGTYSSDKITLYGLGKQLDLKENDSYLGLSNPKLSPNQRFALYNPGEDDCYYEIINLSSGESIKIDSNGDERYCPLEWISSTELKLVRLDAAGNLIEGDVSVMNVESKKIRKL